MLDEAVADLVDDMGREMTLRRVTTATYNPATSAAAVTPADTAIYGFLLEYNDRQRDGTVIQAGDRKAALKALGMASAPKISDLIIADAKSYKIVNIRTIEQYGAAVAYVCQIRG